MKKIFKNFLLCWMPVIIYCMIIYIQSSQSMPEYLPAFFGMDKIFHFFAYAVLSALFFRALNTFKTNVNNEFLVVLASIVAAVLYGITDEIHQYYVISRVSDIVDVVADILGSIFGVFFYRFLVNKYHILRHKIHRLTKPDFFSKR